MSEYRDGNEDGDNGDLADAVPSCAEWSEAKKQVIEWLETTGVEDEDFKLSQRKIALMYAIMHTPGNDLEHIEYFIDDELPLLLLEDETEEIDDEYEDGDEDEEEEDNEDENEEASLTQAPRVTPLKLLI